MPQARAPAITTRNAANAHLRARLQGVFAGSKRRKSRGAIALPVPCRHDAASMQKSTFARCSALENSWPVQMGRAFQIILDGLQQGGAQHPRLGPRLSLMMGVTVAYVFTPTEN